MGVLVWLTLAFLPLPPVAANDVRTAMIPSGPLARPDQAVDARVAEDEDGRRGEASGDDGPSGQDGSDDDEATDTDDGTGGEQTPPDDGPSVAPDTGPQVIDAVIVDGPVTTDDGASAQAANYPSVLINRTGITERYSTDDVWEVWICDVTNRNLSYTLDEALDYLNGPIRDYFGWLSDDQYDVSFVPGGVLRSKYAWNPSSGSTYQHPDCGWYSGSYRSFLAREGIPEISQHDDVISNGLFVGINRSQFTAPVSGIIGLFTYDYCEPSDCDVTFPTNQRRIYVDGAVLSPNTLFRRSQIETAVHELGHGLEWPHSFLGWNKYSQTGQYHNYLDVVSGGEWPSATPATNRLAAGWIADGEIAKHLSTTGAATYTLYPPGQEGTQLLTLPGANATEYYAFSARVDHPFDNMDIYDPFLERTVDASGVTGFYIDQSCATLDIRRGNLSTGDCSSSAESWGLKRRTEPVYRANSDGNVTVYTGHSIPVGQSISMGTSPDDATDDWRVEVADRQGDAFTVFVGSNQAPKRPVNARSTRDSGTQLTAYWEPDTSGLSNFAFEVEYRSGTNAWASPTTGSGTCANSLLSNVRSCTITGLTVGTHYDVRVRGEGGGPDYADGPWTPMGSPPRNAEASAGDTELVVRWDPPPTGANYTTAKHYVEIASGGSFAKPSAGTCSATISASAGRCTITGLTNGTGYSVRVAVLDSSGSGTWSAASSATPTASLADAPATPTVAAGAATLTVSWTAPTDSTVTGHKVSYRTGTAAFATPTGGTCANTVAVGTTSCTITGLVNGTSYDVRLRAVTSAGDGPWSATAAGMPRGTPTAPTGVTATAAHQAIDVAWSLPSSSDAPASTRVEVEYAVTSANPAYTSGCSFTSTTAVEKTQCQITGLTNGTGYTVRVRFSNGTNSAWTTATATPATTAPLQLARPQAWASSDTSLKVTWTAPSSAKATGGSAVTGYRLEHRPYTTSTTAPWETHTIDGHASSLVIGGLAAYQLYQVRVRAANAVGIGPWSAPATGYISPTVNARDPSGVTATVRGSSLDIAWTPSADDTVLHYDVVLERRDNANSAWASQSFIGGCVKPDRLATSCSITHYAADSGLDASKQHRVKMRSRNHRRSSPATAFVQATTAASSTTPSFGTSTISNRTWVTGTEIRPLTLPLASGGTGALSYSLSPALPAGLSFSAATRAVSGRPTAATTGAVTYTYTVTDSATPTANTATLTFTIRVQADSAPGLAAIADVSVPLYRPMATISLPTIAQGTGNISATYAFSGNLPAGLSFDAPRRRILGTPTEKSTANLTWTVRDGDGDSATSTFSITVTDPPSQAVAYPAVLVDEFDRVRLYSQPHPDDSYVTDTWEIWVCNVPNGSLAITPAGVAKLLNDEITPYFRWLSGDKYRPAFVAGGTYQSNQDWTPASSSAMEHPGCGGATVAGTEFGDRVGIPTLAKNDDVSSNGMIVVFDRAIDTLADGLLLYDRCQPRTHLHLCPTSFPANERRIHLDGGVVAADSDGDPTARLRIAAHEIGQAIEFPHSFSASTPVNRHDNLTDLLSGGAFPLGTAAVNRYSAGWIAAADVAKHAASTGSATYTLASPGSSGTQLLTLPGRDADEYYALGARAIQAVDALPTGKEGVEAYRVDHKTSRVHATMSCWTDFPGATPSTAECYGHKRRHEPLTRSDSTDKSYGHLYSPGDTRTVGELRFEVTDRQGSSYTVWVGDKDAPATPADARVNRDSGTQITVSWSAPASGTTPTGYTVQYRTGAAAFAAPTSGTCAATLGASAASCTVTGLTAGTAYDVRVRASAADGAGPWSPVGGAVRNAEAAPGAASIGVTWDGPPPGANHATAQHVVQLRTGANSFAAPASGTCAATTIAASATGCLITGLTNDTAYDVRVAAVDRYGAGAWSGTLQATPKAGLPTTPTTPTVESGDSMITLDWAAQSQQGQIGLGAGVTTVTGYSVQYRTGAAAFAAPTTGSGTCAGTIGASTTTCTITGLTNGTAYDVRLRAATSAGSGPWSANSSGHAASTPAAPTTLSVAAGHQHLTLTWSVPATAQPPVSSAEVETKLTSQNTDSYAAPSGGTCASTLSASTTSCTITGLVNATAYDVRVRFSNGADSEWKTGSGTPVTDRPDAPAALAVNSPSRTSVTVSWQAPSNNGSTITGYTLQHRAKTSDNSAAWSTHSDNGTTLSRTLSGLTTYAKYEFRGRASNANGDGLWSPLAEGGPVAENKPAVPTGVGVTQSVTSLTVTWTAPANSDVQSYTLSLQSRADSTDTWATQAFIGGCASLGIADVTCTITKYSSSLDFDPTKSHRAAVTATNHLGSTQSAWSSASNRLTEPSAPTFTNIVHRLHDQNQTREDTYIDASVALSAGTQLLRWELRYRRVPNSGIPRPWEPWKDLRCGNQNCTSNPLTAIRFVNNVGADVRWDIEMRAVNDIGTGTSARLGIRTEWPHQPTSFTATAGQRRVTLRASVNSSGREPITKWQYKLWTGSTEPATWHDIARTSDSLSHTVTNLTNGTQYSFRVRAVSSVGSTVVAGIRSSVETATPTATTGGNDPGDGNPGGSNPGGGSAGGGGGSGRAASVRLSGPTRYDTAAAVGNRHVGLLETADAATGVRASVDTLIVASGESFPDALAASALSRTLGAPVLLTAKRSLAPAVQAFITRHRIAKVVIVGGPAAVSADVSAAISALGGVASVERIAGPDRFATAAAVAAAAGAPGRLCGTTRPTVILTTGRNFPDALIAGPLAYRGRHPIVLTERDRLPAATAEYLRASGATQAVVIGGRAAVSDAVMQEIARLGMATQRISGADRSDTSVRLARWLTGLVGTSGCFRKDSIGLATGWAFPDALAAAPLLGHYGAPLLLTSPSGVPQSLIDYAADGRLQPDFDLPPIITVGGRTAVPSGHATKLLAALPR